MRSGIRGKGVGGWRSWMRGLRSGMLNKIRLVRGRKGRELPVMVKEEKSKS